MQALVPKKIGAPSPFSYLAEFCQFDIDSKTKSMVFVVFIVVKAENDFDFRSLTFAPALYLIQQTPPRLPVHQSQPKFHSKCFWQSAAKYSLRELKKTP